LSDIDDDIGQPQCHKCKKNKKKPCERAKRKSLM